jgi:hypothetical protein
LSGLWDIEEAGCKAHEKSLWVRELLGIDFLKVLNYNYIALRLSVQPIAISWKGSGAVEGLLSREGAHFLGWDMHVRNEGLWAISLSWHL